MKEILQSSEHRINGDGVKTVNNEILQENDGSTQSLLSEEHDVLRAGNHVLALPYWSESAEAVRSDSTARFSFYVGTILTDGWNTRVATKEDWPWPGIPAIHPQAVNFVGENIWQLNAAKFLDVGPVELPVGSNAEWASLTRLADTKALGNARKALVNLPMIFAERRETIAMIGGKVASMVKGANALQQRSLDEYRKTKPKNRRAAAKRISNEHLEFVFGWMPLISEIEGAVEYIQRDTLDFIRSRGVQSLQLPGAFVTTATDVSPPIQLPYAYPVWGTMWTRKTTRQAISVRTALRYRLATAIVGDMYALGFDPLSTAFDMVPLSFLTGWVSNFDYWIRTISPAVGLEFETGSRNRRATTIVESQGAIQPLHGYHLEGGSTSGSSRRRRDDRLVLETEPAASLEWDVEVGLYEVAAGVSLTLQRYLKPLKRNLALRKFRYKGPRPKWLKEIRYTGRK